MWVSSGSVKGIKLGAIMYSLEFVLISSDQKAKPHHSLDGRFLVSCQETITEEEFGSIIIIMEI